MLYFKGLIFNSTIFFIFFAVLKLADGILLIIILMPSCMAYANKEQDISFGKVTIENTSKQHHHKEVCSPLCVCNCSGCHGYVYNIICSCSIFLIKTIID